MNEMFKKMSNKELYELFDEGEAYMNTGHLSDDAKLRIHTKKFAQDTALNLTFVLSFVWRELAIRGRNNELS